MKQDKPVSGEMFEKMFDVTPAVGKMLEQRVVSDIRERAAGALVQSRSEIARIVSASEGNVSPEQVAARLPIPGVTGEMVAPILEEERTFYLRERETQTQAEQDESRRRAIAQEGEIETRRSNLILDPRIQDWIKNGQPDRAREEIARRTSGWTWLAEPLSPTFTEEVFEEARLAATEVAEAERVEEEAAERAEDNDRFQMEEAFEAGLEAEGAGVLTELALGNYDGAYARGDHGLRQPAPLDARGVHARRRARGGQPVARPPGRRLATGLGRRPDGGRGRAGADARRLRAAPGGAPHRAGGRLHRARRAGDEHRRDARADEPDRHGLRHRRPGPGGGDGAPGPAADPARRGRRARGHALGGQDVGAGGTGPQGGGVQDGRGRGGGDGPAVQRRQSLPARRDRPRGLPLPMERTLRGAGRRGGSSPRRGHRDGERRRRRGGARQHRGRVQLGQARARGHGQFRRDVDRVRPAARRARRLSRREGRPDQLHERHPDGRAARPRGQGPPRDHGGGRRRARAGAGRLRRRLRRGGASEQKGSRAPSAAPLASPAGRSAISSAAVPAAVARASG